jgi:hypothetical protein
MRRSGSVGGSRSLQQLGGWEGAAPVPPPAAAAAGQGAAAAAAPHQQWKRTRYSDVNPQQLTPQQQHFYQAQQFHLRQQQQQQQGLGLPAEGEATDMAALQQQQQDDASKADAMAAAAAAAAAAAGGAPEQAAAGADTLHQSLHNRLQQLLLPELGRQAILQSLDPATQCMVECGSATGIFSVDSERILCLCSSCSEGKGPPGPEFMPSEFERHGGMAACKKWRFSIKVGAWDEAVHWMVRVMRCMFGMCLHCADGHMDATSGIEGSREKCVEEGAYAAALPVQYLAAAFCELLCNLLIAVPAHKAVHLHHSNQLEHQQQL